MTFSLLGLIMFVRISRFSHYTAKIVFTRNFSSSDKFSLLIFGLEGTLIDTRQLHLSSIKKWCAESQQNDYIDDTLLLNVVGEPLEKIALKLLESKSATFESVVLKKCVGDLNLHYYDSIEDNVFVYPNVSETLQTLCDEGYKMAVCSNMEQSVADQILRTLKLRHFFQLVVGSGVLPVAKPDPGPLLYTIEMCGDGVEKVFLLGDSSNDIKAAISAGIPFIGLSYGYSKVPLASLNPEVLIDSFSDIPTTLLKLQDSSMY